jgi:hypothetical protein
MIVDTPGADNLMLHTTISVQGRMILIFFLRSFRSAGDTPDGLT